MRLKYGADELPKSVFPAMCPSVRHAITEGVYNPGVDLSLVNRYHLVLEAAA